MKPRVLVGCPIAAIKQYSLARFLYVLQNLTYDAREIVLVDNSNDGGAFAQFVRKHGVEVLTIEPKENVFDTLIAARELLIEEARNRGCTHFLSLECDVIPPLDVVERLLAHDKDYVAALVDYYPLSPSGRINRVVMVQRQRYALAPGEFSFQLPHTELTPDEMEGGLVSISRAHLACTLIRLAALEGIGLRHTGWQWDDYCLCDDLRAKDVALYCDTNVRPFHMCDGGVAQGLGKSWREEKRDTRLFTLLWGEGYAQQTTKTLMFPFFLPDRGYTDEIRAKIDALALGETLDLSTPCGVHTVTRKQ